MNLPRLPSDTSILRSMGNWRNIKWNSFLESLNYPDILSRLSRNATGPSLNLDDSYFRPRILEKGNNYKFLCRGMLSQPEQDNDNHFHPSVKHTLFEGRIPYGADLKAIDIQRNRDHGLASYNDVRYYCGLKKAQVWSDYLDAIPLKVGPEFKSSNLDFSKNIL